MPSWWTLRQLKSRNPRTRVAAATRLGEAMSPDATEALLAMALGDDEDTVRAAAADSLKRHEPWVIAPRLVELLRHPSSEMRSRASETLVRFGLIAAPALRIALEAGIAAPEAEMLLDRVAPGWRGATPPPPPRSESNPTPAAPPAESEPIETESIEVLVDRFLGGEAGWREARHALDRLGVVWTANRAEQVVEAFKAGTFRFRTLTPRLALPVLPLLVPLLTERKLRWRLGAAWALVRFSGRQNFDPVSWQADPEYVIRAAADRLLAELAGPTPAGKTRSHTLLAFCSPCGREMEMNLANSAFDAFGGDHTHWSERELPAFVCSGCDRFWCHSCAGVDRWQLGLRCQTCEAPLRRATGQDAADASDRESMSFVDEHV